MPRPELTRRIERITIDSLPVSFPVVMTAAVYLSTGERDDIAMTAVALSGVVTVGGFLTILFLGIRWNRRTTMWVARAGLVFVVIRFAVALTAGP